MHTYFADSHMYCTFHTVNAVAHNIVSPYVIGFISAVPYRRNVLRKAKLLLSALYRCKHIVIGIKNGIAALLYMRKHFAFCLKYTLS